MPVAQLVLGVAKGRHEGGGDRHGEERGAALELRVIRGGRVVARRGCGPRDRLAHEERLVPVVALDRDRQGRGRRRLGHGGARGHEGAHPQRVQPVDRQLDQVLAAPGQDRGLEGPPAPVPADADVKLGGGRGLEVERARLEDGDGQDALVAQLLDGHREGLGEGAAHHVDPVPPRGEQVKPLAGLGGAPDQERRRDRGPSRGVGPAGGEGYGQPGVVEAVVGERLAAPLDIGHPEARLVVEELQLADDPAHRVGIGPPLDGPGEEPGVAAPLQAEGSAGRSAGHLQRAYVRGLGAEDPPPDLERNPLGAQAALEVEDVDEQDRVQEKEDERDFGAHGSCRVGGISGAASSRRRSRAGRRRRGRPEAGGGAGGAARRR